MNVAWTYDDEKVCVEAFFKFIDFDKTLKMVRKEIIEYIKLNVKNYEIRTHTSWVLKIDNIHYLFRVWCGLPKAGLKGKTSKQVEIMNIFFENSKFKNSTDKFSKEWFISKKSEFYKLKKYDPESDKKETIIVKLIRNKKIVTDYLNQVNFCENCLKENTFISLSSGKMYFEVHHFIPYNEEVQKNYEINLDNYYNLVSLCPECHRAIHLSEQRNTIIKNLFDKKIRIKEFKGFYGENGIEKIISDYKKTNMTKDHEVNFADFDDDLYDFVI
ncbi:HNH endonuclease signature motif containing protein [Spiroplasma endosymbiont of Dioctria linearis]|uniref:HNH endonuclease signature motif containing protein n=1 Tax=Spiroplasma endosymbiont of Dioctria linearis TaxID=3066290 RepID=UPI00313DAC47